MEDQDRQLVRNGQIIEETLNTKGWTDIIEPLLSKMIEDIIGSKNLDGTWDVGGWGDKRIGEIKADRLLWYRRALMDFNNHIYSFLSSAESAIDRLKEEEEKQKEDLKDPMLDSSYNIKGN